MLYSPRWLFLYPGLLLSLTGLLVGILILSGPRTVGGVTFDVHTLLYASAAVFLGYLSVSYAIFAKIFTANEGLLPQDPRLNRFTSLIRLEVGILVGLALAVVGLAGSIWALSDWGARSFGPLDTSRTFRIVIPSVLALALGCHIVFSSFFLSVLGLGRHRGYDL